MVEPNTFGGRLPQTLLRLLATRRGTPVPFDVLAEALWPRRTPADPMANLNVLASRVRRALKSPRLIVATDGGYAIPATAPCVVDAEQFLADVRHGDELVRAGRHENAVRSFETALGRWIGEPLSEDLYADWAQPYRRTLLRERVHAVEASGMSSLLVGDATAALRRADEAVCIEPLRESANLLLMRALAASGDPASAVDAYAAFRARLADETGLDPSGEAEGDYLRLIRGELTITHPGQIRAGHDQARGDRVPGLGPPRNVSGVRERVTSSAPLDELPFVGRAHELGVVLDDVSAPNPGIVVVEGTPGVGKSRLLAEVMHRADRRTLAARAFLAERDEAWGLARRLLREALAADVSAAVALPERFAVALGDVVPELAEIREISPLFVEPASRRALAVEGSVRLLGAVAGDGLLVADDLQWADVSSLAVLNRFRARYPYAGVVVALRPPVAVTAGAVWAFLDDAAHATRVTRIELGPLTADAVGDVVVGEELVTALAENTDRTPVALIESIRTLADQGLLRRRDDGRWTATASNAGSLAAHAARDGHRRAIERRASALPPSSRDVLNLLAALGRETSIGVLADAVGRSARDVLDELDSLARAGLADLGERGWRTSHDVVAEAVLAYQDGAASAKTHATLARVLADDGADPAEIGRHLAHAGDLAGASVAFAQAAWNRLARFADAEAGQLASAGLELEPKLQVRAELLETRAESRARAGDLAGAADDLRSALRAGSKGPERARVLARHARLAVSAQDLEGAGEWVALALAEAGSDARARAAALYAGSIVDMNTDNPQRARERADEALHLFERAGDAHGVADILDARAMATFLDGHLVAAVEAFDRVAQMFMDTGDLFRAVTPRSTRGHALVFMAEPSSGLAETEDALEIARSLDRSDSISYALWHRSEALAALGRADEAVAAALESVGNAERIGHRSWTVAALRALGIALHVRGDLDGAEHAFRRALDQSAHWPLFTSWSCARIAMVRLAVGDLSNAEPVIARALGIGPPLAHYEARLARAELAVKAGETGAAHFVADALSQAEAGGHMVSAARLGHLARALSAGASSIG